MDPRQAGDTITALVLEQIFETPYTVTPTGTVEPWLFAEKLRQDRGGDQPIYSAAVRQGIVFSDGTPLTADLAAMSLAKTKALFGRTKVAAVNDRVVFTMSGPSPRFDMVLTQWNTAIVLERSGGFLGTGPYVLAPGSTLNTIKQAGVTQLDRNTRYWNKAHVDELLFVIYPAEPDGTPLKLIEARSGERSISP